MVVEKRRRQRMEVNSQARAEQWQRKAVDILGSFSLGKGSRSQASIRVSPGPAPLLHDLLATGCMHANHPTRKVFPVSCTFHQSLTRCMEGIQSSIRTPQSRQQSKDISLSVISGVAKSTIYCISEATPPTLKHQ